MGFDDSPLGPSDPVSGLVRRLTLILLVLKEGTDPIILMPLLHGLHTYIEKVIPELAPMPIIRSTESGFYDDVEHGIRTGQFGPVPDTLPEEWEL